MVAVMFGVGGGASTGTAKAASVLLWLSLLPTLLSALSSKVNDKEDGVTACQEIMVPLLLSLPLLLLLLLLLLQDSRSQNNLVGKFDFNFNDFFVVVVVAMVLALLFSGSAAVAAVAVPAANSLLLLCIGRCCRRRRIGAGADSVEAASPAKVAADTVPSLLLLL